MNQTRTFLLIAWIVVATLLWFDYSKQRAAAAAPTAQPASTEAAGNVAPNPGIPGIPGVASGQGVGAIPSATPSGAVAAVAAPMPQSAASSGNRITVSTDVLRLSLDANTVFEADLLRYPQVKGEDNTPVKLFNADPAYYYVAQSGWVAGGKPVAGFMPETAQRELTLAPGQAQLDVVFVRHGDDGVDIRRTFTFHRGSYAIDVRDAVVNDSAHAWQGYIYRQLSRVPPQVKRGMTNPESYSFAGAKWFGSQDGYEGRRFKDFVDDGPLEKTVTGGWIALLQHHFFSAWIQQPDQQARFELAQEGNVDSIHALGPSFSLQPGQKAATDARLWVGPKLVAQIKAQNVPGFERAVDYSRFAVFAILGEGLFWVLSKLHGLFGNWGWAIIALVCLLKLALFPLSAAQYKSAAKMRKFQPRIAQLKERYGDDKQKFQVAMMELYKKEKINPVGGCLPVIPQMIIFMALYWVLMESVELRQVPWALWIQDLTARDPYFILPALNIAIMWATQKLNPAVGMDPMQQKMMQAMPLVFGVILAFLPAGLVLYQVANGGLGLLQQWIITRKYADPPSKAVAG